MDLLTLIVVLVVVGLVIYLIQGYLPIDPKIKQIVVAIVIIILVVWLLQGIGLLPGTISLR
jgi:hypothetical protein